LNISEIPPPEAGTGAGGGGLEVAISSYLGGVGLAARNGVAEYPGGFANTGGSFPKMLLMFLHASTIVWEWVLQLCRYGM